MPKRSISTEIWADTWFESLKGDEKLIFLYLLTNERTNMLGIYEISIRKISFETGIKTESIRKALERFESDSKVKYTDDCFIIIKNFLKQQSFNTNMMRSAVSKYNELPKSIKTIHIEILDNDINEAFESVLKALEGFEIVPNIEVKYKDKDKEEVKGKDKSAHPPKSKYGEGQIIQLSDDEYQKLINGWGNDGKAYKTESNLEWAITELDLYMRSKGKTYKDHYATLQGWVYNKFTDSTPAELKDADDPYADVDGETMFMSAEDHLKASQY